jgi:hypothetical protein
MIAACIASDICVFFSFNMLSLLDSMIKMAEEWQMNRVIASAYGLQFCDELISINFGWITT